MPDPLHLAQRIAATRRRPVEEHPEGFYELVLEWLNEADEEVRMEALLFLARHLRQRSDAQQLLDIMLADSSTEVRRCAAECLGGIFRSTRHRQVCEILATVAKDLEEDDTVRGAAYAAIKKINGR